VSGEWSSPAVIGTSVAAISAIASASAAWFSFRSIRRADRRSRVELLLALVEILRSDVLAETFAQIEEAHPDFLQLRDAGTCPNGSAFERRMNQLLNQFELVAYLHHRQADFGISAEDLDALFRYQLGVLNQPSNRDFFIRYARQYGYENLARILMSNEARSIPS